jgi:CRP/FNR family transcriptional regulator, cyclic AMP receptor protein
VHGSGFWGLLGDREQEALGVTAKPRAFQDGAMLCMEGEPSTHLFILLSGWVKVIAVNGEGRESVVALRGDGDIVGEVAQVTGYRTATVRATGTVRTLIVAADQFGVFLDAHPDAARAYRRIMTEYERAAHESQRSHAMSSGPRRLACLLLDLADRHGERIDGGIATALPLSQDELASLIGSSRSTVTRALSDWRSRRVITTQQRQVTILDQATLLRIAGRR